MTVSSFKNNEEAKTYAKKFVDEELLGFFDLIEKNTWFGTLYHHPGNKGMAEFVFQDGMCKRCIEPMKGKNNTFNKTTKFGG